MKRGTLILALCGVVGVAVTVGLGYAQDGFRSGGGSSFDQPNSKRTVQYFSRSGKSVTQVKKSSSETAGRTQTFSETRPSEKKSGSRFQRGVQVQEFPGAKSQTSGRVIQATFNQKNGAAAKGTIKQVGSTEDGSSLFKPVKPAEQPRVFQPAVKPAVAKSVSPRVITKTVTASSGPSTAMLILQWVKSGDINVGMECECGLLVKNGGKVTAKHVAVVASFPTSVRLTGAKPMPSEHQGQLLWKFNSLAPGEKKLIKIKMIPSQRGQLVTSASVRFTGMGNGAFTVKEPMLKLALTGTKEVLVGDSASQIILVSNPGTGIATNVKIEARIPKGLSHPRGELLIMDIGSLNPGESRKVRLALSAIKGGHHKMAVQATSDVALKQQLVKDVNVVAPSIKIAMKGPGLRYLGRKALYTVNVANTGTGATNNVRVLHRVPEGFKFLRADKGGKYDADKRILSWFIGRVEPGQSQNVKVELSSVKLGDHRHRIGAISEQGAKSETTFDTKIDGTASLVLEIVDLDDPVEVGTETAYEVRIRNSGTKAASKVILSCELPPGVTLIKAKGPTDSIAENGLIVFKSLGKLQPGKTAVYQVQVRGKIAGNHRFRARLASESIRNPLTYEELTKFYVD